MGAEVILVDRRRNPIAQLEDVEVVKSSSSSLLVDSSQANTRSPSCRTTVSREKGDQSVFPSFTLLRRALHRPGLGANGPKPGNSWVYQQSGYHQERNKQVQVRGSRDNS